MLKYQYKAATKLISLILAQVFLLTGIVYSESITNKNTSSIYIHAKGLRVPMMGGGNQNRLRETETIIAAQNEKDPREQLRPFRTYSAKTVFDALELNGQDTYMDLAGGPGTYTAVASAIVKEAIYLDISPINLSLTERLLRNLPNLTDAEKERLLKRQLVNIVFMVDKILARGASERDLPINTRLILGDARNMRGEIQDNSVTKLSVTELFKWLEGQRGEEQCIEEMLRIIKPGGRLFIVYDFSESDKLAEFEAAFKSVARRQQIEIDFRKALETGIESAFIVDIKEKSLASDNNIGRRDFLNLNFLGKDEAAEKLPDESESVISTQDPLVQKTSRRNAIVTIGRVTGLLLFQRLGLAEAAGHAPGSIAIPSKSRVEFVKKVEKKAMRALPLTRAMENVRSFEARLSKEEQEFYKRLAVIVEFDINEIKALELAETDGRPGVLSEDKGAGAWQPTPGNVSLVNDQIEALENLARLGKLPAANEHDYTRVQQLRALYLGNEKISWERCRHDAFYSRAVGAISFLMNYKLFYNWKCVRTQNGGWQFKLRKRGRVMPNGQVILGEVPGYPVKESTIAAHNAGFPAVFKALNKFGPDNWRYALSSETITHRTRWLTYRRATEAVNSRANADARGVSTDTLIGASVESLGSNDNLGPLRVFNGFEKFVNFRIASDLFEKLGPGFSIKRDERFRHAIPLLLVAKEDLKIPDEPSKAMSPYYHYPTNCEPCSVRARKILQTRGLKAEIKTIEFPEENFPELAIDRHSFVITEIAGRQFIVDITADQFEPTGEDQWADLGVVLLPVDIAEQNPEKFWMYVDRNAPGKIKDLIQQHPRAIESGL